MKPKGAAFFLCVEFGQGEEAKGRVLAAALPFDTVDEVMAAYAEDGHLKGIRLMTRRHPDRADTSVVHDRWPLTIAGGRLVTVEPFKKRLVEARR